jgi:hypothetical protein
MLPRIPILGDALSRFLEANARYHTALGRVTVEFLRELAVVLEAPQRATQESPRDHSNGVPRQPEPAPPPAQPVAPRPIILLEAEAEGTAVGVFLLANHLDHEILARPEASPFFDPPETAATPRVTFEPETVSLAPQERMLVKMIAAVDKSLQPDVRYHCEVSVPALAGTRIPVVIRRRPDRPQPVEASPPPAEVTPPAEAKPARRSGPARKKPRKSP